MRARLERTDAKVARGYRFFIFNAVRDLPRALTQDFTTVPVPLCGHLPHEERPDVVNAALLDFLGGRAG